MKILFVDSQYPMPDRASADVRMFAIVGLLRQQNHDCHYLATDLRSMAARVGRADVDRYRSALKAISIVPHDGIGLSRLLADSRFDVVFFKYFYPAEHGIKLVRIWQPWARIVTDSVDLVYVRLAAKARLSRAEADQEQAQGIKARELKVYSQSDLVITVTDDEAQTLRADLPGVPIRVVPNIHELPARQRQETSFPSLLFIGTFTHEPNVDGIMWFANEVWPSIHASYPDARLRIVGGHAPPEVAGLDGGGIEVLGYVPAALPLLMESWVSIAPLRFGAGMKGKVGEAMAAGLPVVTTSFGAEGFGLTPGIELLVADQADSFATAVLRLLADPAFRQALGTAGRSFIDLKYSPQAVGRQLSSLAAQLEQIPPQRVHLHRTRRFAWRIGRWMHRHLFWRLAGTPATSTHGR